MNVLNFVLLALSAVCFLLAANNVAVRVGRDFNLVALGLLFWVLVPLIATFRILVD